jgi:nucleoside-diphosphate-sugar epimerase
MIFLSIKGSLLKADTIPRNVVKCLYIDIRDAASAYIAALEKDNLCYNDLNITADDTFCDWDTQRLTRTYYPEIADIRESLEGHQALENNAKAKELLGWRPQFSWWQEI